MNGKVRGWEEEHPAVVAVVEFEIHFPHEEGVRVLVHALHPLLVVYDEVAVHVYGLPHFLNDVRFGILGIRNSLCA